MDHPKEACGDYVIKLHPILNKFKSVHSPKIKFPPFNSKVILVPGDGLVNNMKIEVDLANSIKPF